MCKFCESLKDNTKEITWQVRSTYADDNICEFVNDNNCSTCSGCKTWFKLDGYNWNDNIYVGVSFNQELTATNGEKVIIRPFSESLQFNYCPICGVQLSKTIIDFDKVYSIEIEDKK